MSHTNVLARHQAAGEVTPAGSPADSFRRPLPAAPQPSQPRIASLCEALEEADRRPPPQARERLRVDPFLAELLAGFVNVASGLVDSQIESALRRIVELLGIEEGGFGEWPAGLSRPVMTHSYLAPGLPPATRAILDEWWPSQAETTPQGEVIRLPDDLPSDASRAREDCARVGLKSQLTVPLKGVGPVTGAIRLTSFRSRRDWPDELIPRLRLVGDIFTNALARKRADEALRAREHLLRQAREDLRHLAASLMHAQEEERRRIAREMHDDWAQRLALLGIGLASLEKNLGSPEAAVRLLRTMGGQVAGLAEDMRGLSRQLHPSILEDLGLEEALRSECACFSRREGVAISYLPEEVPAAPPRDVALCVYRIAQEALRNVARHAKVTRARVILAGVGPELLLRIEDEGVGFDPTKARRRPGLGLSSIRERSRMIQAHLTITSCPGRGTTVEVRAPLAGSSP